jgi:hypothetical protein
MKIFQLKVVYLYGVMLRINVCTMNSTDKKWSKFKLSLMLRTNYGFFSLVFVARLSEPEISRFAVWKQPMYANHWFSKTKLNPVALVRKLTIPTERQSLVGEVSSKLCW